MAHVHISSSVRTNLWYGISQLFIFPTAHAVNIRTFHIDSRQKPIQMFYLIA